MTVRTYLLHVCCFLRRIFTTITKDLKREILKLRSVFNYYLLHSLDKIRMKCNEKNVSNKKNIIFTYDLIYNPTQTIIFFLVSMSRFYDGRLGN